MKDIDEFKSKTQQKASEKQQQSQPQPVQPLKTSPKTVDERKPSANAARKDSSPVTVCLGTSYL